DRRRAHPAAGQLPLLLRPGHPVRHRARGDAARRADPAAGPAVPAALAARAEADGLPARLRQAQAAPVEHPGGREAGRVGAGRARPAPGLAAPPARPLRMGRVVSAGLSFAVRGYTSSVWGGPTPPPAHSASPAGTPLLPRHFPQSSANPTSLIFRFADPVWQHPAALAAGTEKLKSNALFTTVSGPLNPAGAPLPPALYASLHDKLGPASALPPAPPAASRG